MRKPRRKLPFSRRLSRCQLTPLNLHNSPIPHPPVPAPAITLSKPSAIVLAWGLVALALGMTYVARRLILVGRLGDRREVDDNRLLDTLTVLATDAGVRRPPRLTCTSRISSPVALGLDEICVP